MCYFATDGQTSLPTVETLRCDLDIAGAIPTDDQQMSPQQACNHAKYNFRLVHMSSLQGWRFLHADSSPALHRALSRQPAFESLQCCLLVSLEHRGVFACRQKGSFKTVSAEGLKSNQPPVRWQSTSGWLCLYSGEVVGLFSAEIHISQLGTTSGSPGLSEMLLVIWPMSPKHPYRQPGLTVLQMHPLSIDVYLMRGNSKPEVNPRKQRAWDKGTPWAGCQLNTNISHTIPAICMSALQQFKYRSKSLTFHL